MAKGNARRRRNPKWKLDPGIVIDTDRGIDGKWSYRTTVADDGTEIDIASGFATEDEAVRVAMEEAEDSADYQQLREGYEPIREPDHAEFGQAIWWGPGDVLEEVDNVIFSRDDGCVVFWDWIGEGDEPTDEVWSKRLVCPEPSPTSHRLRAEVADAILQHWGGGAEETQTQKDFEYEFRGIIPSKDDAQGNPQRAGTPFQKNPSALEVIYDGRRRGRDMIYIEPWSLWGERAYGLSPREDDYTFDTRAVVGDRTRVVVSDATYQRLIAQRETRISYRRAR